MYDLCVSVRILRFYFARTSELGNYASNVNLIIFIRFDYLLSVSRGIDSADLCNKVHSLNSRRAETIYIAGWHKRGNLLLSLPNLKSPNSDLPGAGLTKYITHGRSLKKEVKSGNVLLDKSVDNWAPVRDRVDDLTETLNELIFIKSFQEWLLGRDFDPQGSGFDPGQSPKTFR